MPDQQTEELASALQRLVEAQVEAAQRRLLASEQSPTAPLLEGRAAGLDSSRYLDWAREVYAVRRARGKHFPAVFGEPTWDLLLDLYIAFLEGRKVTTKSACIGAECPTSTALRKILDLEEAGLLYRVDDLIDKRLKWIAISKEGIWAMNRLADEAMNLKRRARG